MTDEALHTSPSLTILGFNGMSENFHPVVQIKLISRKAHRGLALNNDSFLGSVSPPVSQVYWKTLLPRAPVVLCLLGW